MCIKMQNISPGRQSMYIATTHINYLAFVISLAPGCVILFVIAVMVLRLPRLWIRRWFWLIPAFILWIIGETVMVNVLIGESAAQTTLLVTIALVLIWIA